MSGGWVLLVPAGAPSTWAPAVADCPRPVVTVTTSATDALALLLAGDVEGIACAVGRWQLLDSLPVEGPESWVPAGPVRRPRRVAPGERRPVVTWPAPAGRARPVVRPDWTGKAVGVLLALGVVAAASPAWLAALI